ncbi:MAG: aspartate-semialdehyde dehydrogenase [Methylacidiphilales bacterium]|nr:aspartate-semialdehyde dehydrogenase [Candidatus Methylacidiphilales bacterium]
MKTFSKFGFIGWRGMVGSVLIDRLIATKTSAHILDAEFFSTSASTQKIPQTLANSFATRGILLNAYDLDALTKFEVLVSCQGSEYSKLILPQLITRGWKGIWIDAASAFRMDADATLLFPPINQNQIEQDLQKGRTKYIGTNCTVSLMLMAIAPLITARKITWLTSMTYQAASGAGANQLRELIAQMCFIGKKLQPHLDDTTMQALTLGNEVQQCYYDSAFPKEHFAVPLAGSVIPFIDKKLESGQSKEEWKAQAEANKLLGFEKNPIPIDSICVRVGVLRCHSQALTILLDKEYPEDELISLFQSDSPFVKIIGNDETASRWLLTPAHVSGSLDIYVGRIRKSTIDKKAIHCFTVGDQLLWGAAEPLRCLVHRLSTGTW